MAQLIDKSTLGYLGIDYQYALVKCFIEEPHFFVDLSSIIDANVFTDTHLRSVVGLLKNHYEKDGIVPSYVTLNTRLRARATTDIQIQEAEEIINKLKDTSNEDWEFVKSNAIKFFKKQHLIIAAKKMLEKASNGDVDEYDDCRKIIEEALMAGGNEDYGHSVYDLLDPALSDDYTISIPTGINRLDEALGGGLDKGKLGLIICSLGVGKTTLSCALSSYAASCRNEYNNYEGWKVLQIYFEDDDVDIVRKHIGKLTGKEASEIKRCDDATRQSIKNIMENHENKSLINANLRLIRMRTGEKSATQIKKQILKMTNAGFKPDMVIIDYFECLAPEKGGFQTDSAWDREGRSMRTLENMAKDLDIALWLPTQGTKDSIGKEELGANMAGGSVKKSQIAQVILTVGKSVEQAMQNRATMFLSKNRGGKATKLFRDIYFNNGTCEVKCDDKTYYDESLTWSEEKKRIDESDRNTYARMAFKAMDNDKQETKNLVYSGV